MPNVTLSTLTGTDLHEPKGADSASSNAVYVADGAGAGTWTVVNNTNQMVMEMMIADISVAKSHFIVSPMAGTITKIYCVIHQAIATADTVLTTEIGGTAVTNGTITITQSGSAAGDVDEATPTAFNTVTAGQAIEVACDGGTNTSDAHAHLTFVVDVS